MIAIIDHVDIFGGREKQQLMELGGGHPYRYMLEYIYPPLRRTEMEVISKVRYYLPDEVERSMIVARRISHRLEIYEVAMRRNSDRTPLSRYGKEFDVAADYFPR